MLEFSTAHLNLKYTLECGQAFRWKYIEGWYYGVVHGSLVRIRQEKNHFWAETNPVSDNGALIKDYFKLTQPYAEMIKSIAVDEVMQRATQQYYGLRVVRQDPWECLISYIISANNRIPMIEESVLRISRKLGQEVRLGDYVNYTFPSPETLAAAELSGLADCSLGFRDKYVMATAQRIARENIDLKQLRDIPYLEAKEFLMSFPGVGPKVSDCVLLFALDKESSFPIDTWIKQVLERLYFGGETVNLNVLQEFAKRYGEWSGLAQEFLFYLARHELDWRKQKSAPTPEAAQLTVKKVRQPRQKPSASILPLPTMSNSGEASGNGESVEVERPCTDDDPQNTAGPQTVPLKDEPLKDKIIQLHF